MGGNGFCKDLALQSAASSPCEDLWETVGSCLRTVPPQGEEVGGFIPELPTLKGQEAALTQGLRGISSLSHDWPSTFP